MPNAMRKMAEYLGLVDSDQYNQSYDAVEEYVEYEEQYTQAPLRSVAPSATWKLNYLSG